VSQWCSNPWYHRHRKSHLSFREQQQLTIPPLLPAQHLPVIPYYHAQQVSSASSRAQIGNTVGSDSSGGGGSGQNISGSRKTNMEHWKQWLLDSRTAFKMWQVSSNHNNNDYSKITPWANHLVVAGSLRYRYPTNKLDHLLSSWWTNPVQTMLLPRGYPHSVAIGYAPLAGSASMVLSTQTLLLALMIGSNSAEIGDSSLLLGSSSGSSEARECHHDEKESSDGPVSQSTTTMTRAVPTSRAPCRRWRSVPPVAQSIGSLRTIWGKWVECSRPAAC
jgi:hypothetical protein